MDHKILQKLGQPQTPTIKPRKKVKDPERFRDLNPNPKYRSFSKQYRTIIGAAALTGGATAAGESLFMAGTTGLRGR